MEDRPRSGPVWQWNTPPDATDRRRTPEGRACSRNGGEEAGCTMGLDTNGPTCFAQREWHLTRCTAVLCRSHLGIRKPSGRANMNGVLGGLWRVGNCCARINDLGIKPKSTTVVVTNWTNRRGPAMRPPMLLAPCVLRHHPQNGGLMQKTDAEGLSFGDELKRIGSEQGDERRSRPGSYATPFSSLPHRTGPDPWRQKD